jgi:glycolate oxidase iron-sulfur subunit
MDIISECLLCGSCREECPNGVMTDEIILAGRAKFMENKGLSLPKRALSKILSDYPYLIPLLLKFGSLIKDRLSINRFIPLLDKEPFLNRNPKIIKGRELKVGFFVGCVYNYILQNVAFSTINVLKNNEITIITPRDQVCCGLPLLTLGDINGVKRLILKNIEAFSQFDIDYIVVSCASCLFTIKKYYNIIFEDEKEEIKNKVNSFVSKAIDISIFLVNILDYRPLNRMSGIVTYHDPCHHYKGLKIINEPRILLEPYKFIEMKESNGCCGFGGIFNIKHYDLSSKIGNKKIENILDTGANIVATPCSGCILHLMNGINKRNLNIKILHPIELLEENL